MEDIYVTEHIKEICKQRGWSYYKLAKESGISHSSLNYTMKHQHVPTINTLIKICNGLDITLSQFFDDIDNNKSEEQDKLISLWNLLNEKEKELALIYIYGLLHKTPPQKES